MERQHLRTAQSAGGRDLRLLTARDLESWLKIDIKTIYQYVQRKLIPHIRIQSNVRFVEPEIRRWLERHEHFPSNMNKSKGSN